ncbi:glycosyltransferase family 4 protein [Sphingobacterium sp. UT-1RO-CII-1]|uniref:glycosyltransferase family 4 protein n=1 Tax=Sphingobacterium sp. UT-1RO-CII-1 TaxID=2995225 RepID=UPI00227A317B|nr:glycosyltransferase family 4 protein [Sphingobacterium sp. UT-1RO-CII-1]MCY4780800.1 glycosyltransferase family 4 protein [Sphingobacterium sp. UT-1RO-CII-1]
MGFVLISSNISNSGGTERIGIGLANELVARYNMPVLIISLFGSGKPFFYTDSRVKIVRLFSKHNSLFILFPFVVWKIRRELLCLGGQSVIINIGALLTVFTVCANLGLKHKNIVWEHFNMSLIFKSFKEKFSRYIATRYADAIVTLTVGDKIMYEQNFDCRAEMMCIPNFLTFPVEKREIVKDNKVAIAVGRFTEQKSFDRLIEIWSLLGKEAEGWELKIIGDGEERDTLANLINKYNCKNVFLLPTSDTVQKYYEQASVYLMTSKWEGLPMVLIEAQSYGLPIISYDCLTGPRDIIEDGYNGFLIPDGDSDSFVHALQNFMRDDGLRRELSINAQVDSRRFNKNVILEKWTGLFDKLLAS